MKGQQGSKIKQCYRASSLSEQTWIGNTRESDSKVRQRIKRKGKRGDKKQYSRMQGHSRSPISPPMIYSSWETVIHHVPSMANVKDENFPSFLPFSLPFFLFPLPFLSFSLSSFQSSWNLPNVHTQLSIQSPILPMERNKHSLSLFLLSIIITSSPNI